MCQCPIRANHHFYVTRTHLISLIPYIVSMPYTGEPSFLPLMLIDEDGSRELCQCPIRANHHFYKTMKGLWIGLGVCQCPIRANHHFYVCWHNNGIQVYKSVNALYGRTIISTANINIFN